MYLFLCLNCRPRVQLAWLAQHYQTHTDRRRSQTERERERRERIKKPFAFLFLPFPDLSNCTRYWYLSACKKAFGFGGALHASTQTQSRRRALQSPQQSDLLGSQWCQLAALIPFTNRSKRPCFVPLLLLPHIWFDFEGCPAIMLLTLWSNMEVVFTPITTTTTTRRWRFTLVASHQRFALFHFALIPFFSF